MISMKMNTRKDIDNMFGFGCGFLTTFSIVASVSQLKHAGKLEGIGKILVPFSPKESVFVWKIAQITWGTTIAYWFYTQLEDYISSRNPNNSFMIGYKNALCTSGIVGWSVYSWIWMKSLIKND